MDFAEFSKKTIEKIDKEIEDILTDWRIKSGKISKSLLPLVDEFIRGSKGGKRIRGMLVVLGYELGKQSTVYSLQSTAEDGKRKTENILKIAAAYEIFHTAILAHDDVIDQSKLRRGQASLYQALGGNHCGISQAISLGDCGFFLASRVISEAQFPEQKKVKALQFFFKVMLDTGLGEMLDVGRGDALTIMKLKTARYTIAGPLQLGAILAGAKEQLLRLLGDFGEGLGIAFQIQDDILGVFGSFKRTGKSVTSDIEEGKNTLLFQYAFKNADAKQRNVLEKLYGRGKIEDQGVESLKQVFKKTRALDCAKEEAEKYRIQAMKMLPEITKDDEMSKLLEQITQND